MILRGSFFSKTLEMETALSVLIPNLSLRRPARKVVYLLHGLCGRSGDWIDYTMLPAYAELYDAAFVMPEVARSFYTDMRFGQSFYGYVVDELPTIIQSAFNVAAGRENTLVIGASMGGYGALKCALSRPGQYGYCGAFSSACLFLEEGLDRQRGGEGIDELRKAHGDRLLNDFEAIFGTELEWKPEYEIVELAKKASIAGVMPELYLACGTEDGLLASNRRFEAAMRTLPLPFAYQEMVRRP